jgi:cystathionine beta-lyase/cystathionine gamma-synthase
MSAHSAFFLLNELRTLRLRIASMSANTMTVARFLEQHPKVERVDYLGLSHHRQHDLACRYLRLVDDGTPTFGHLMSFNIAGSAADTRRFFDALQRIYRATDLGRIKSVATLPAISTHAQQGEEGRKLAGIPPTMVRLCVGGEHPDDVIADLDQALRQI